MITRKLGLDFENTFSSLRSRGDGILSRSWYLQNIAATVYNATVTAFDTDNRRIQDYLWQATNLWNYFDTIITMNWDTLLEVYARSEPDEWALVPRKSLTAKLLLKLHGSIDWFTLDREHQDSTHFEKLAGKYWRYRPFSEGNDIFAVHNSVSAVLGGPPALIAPTHTKSIPGGLFRRIWSAAYHTLRWADHVLIAGYCCVACPLAQKPCSRCMNVGTRRSGMRLIC